jgi:hypothetical protein
MTPAVADSTEVVRGDLGNFSHVLQVIKAVKDGVDQSA